MPFLFDIWHAIQGVVLSSDWITLVLMAVIALGAGFLMHNITSLPATAVIALIAFAMTGYIRAVVVNKQNAGAFAITDWQAFLNLQMKTLLPYLLLFLVAIALAHGLRLVTLRRH